MTFAANTPNSGVLAPKTLLLASESSYKRKQLRSLGLDFQCLAPKIDESAGANECASELAERLSLEKALKCQRDNSLVIAADQSAELEADGDNNKRLLGKPGSNAAAIEQLLCCSGKSAIFYSAICVLDGDSGASKTAVSKTKVQFRTLTNAQIEHYLSVDEPYDCAGSFKVESLGIALFEAVESSDPSALIGLPLIALTKLLAEHGVDVLNPKGLG